MAFMRIETMVDTWYMVETLDNGTDYVPASVCGDLDLEKGEPIDDDSERWAECLHQIKDYVDGHKIQSIEFIGEQWAARYSAPGYMDCTDWALGDTEAEARDECVTIYGDEEDCDE